MFESLESRQLLAVNWRNPVNANDVTGDGATVPIDALNIINEINNNGSRPLADQKDPNKPFWDATGDQFLAPLDALQVINALNAGNSSPFHLLESDSLASEAKVTITLGQTAGTRKYRLRLDANFDTSDQSRLLEDVVSVYLVSAAASGETLLDRGHAGTSLFQLSGTHVETRPGISTWDGSVLELDLTSISDRDTGLLTFQLLNSDADNGTKVTIQPLSNHVDPDAIPVLPPAGIATATSASGPTDLTGLPPTTAGEARLENIRFDLTTQRYAGDLRIANRSSDVVSSAVVGFPGLPSGVSLRNPSGFTDLGVPYLNLESVFPTNGLAVGRISERVLVEFDNAANIKFMVQPEIFAQLGLGEAPVLQPIPTLRVNPGGFVSTTLQATDPDGDFVSFSIATNRPLPTGRLQAGGNLFFAPTESEIGTYDFSVVASDGLHRSTQPVQLVVERDSETTTRVSGKVLNTLDQPIAEITVRIGERSAVTAADGTYELEVPDDLPANAEIVIHGEEFAGAEVYSRYDIPLRSQLNRPLVVGEENVFDRPHYLVPMNMAHAVRVTPGTFTNVNVPSIPHASLTIAPQSVFDRDGNLYDGPITFASIPIDRTIVELPDSRLPAEAFVIQPAGLKFTSPVTFGAPNSTDLPPNSFVEVCKAAQERNGAVICEGIGQVSANGSEVKPTPVSGPEIIIIIIFYKDDFDVDVLVIPEEEECNPCDSSASKEPGAPPPLYATGKTRTNRKVAEYESDEQTHRSQLVFDSERADPQSFVRFGLSNIAGDENDRMVGKLVVNYGNFDMEMGGNPGGANNLAGGEQFWMLPTTGETAQARLLADLSTLPSGVFDYTMTSGSARVARGSVSTVTRETSGSLISVNSIGSPFGAGWGLVGLQEIVESSDGSALLIDGDGTRLVFRAPVVAGHPFQSPAGDFSVLTRSSDGSFQRRMTDQSFSQFDATGKLVAVIDRTGSAMRYEYLPGGSLDSITDGAGQVTRFAYSGARVASITDPAGRITRLQHDADGNLTQMTYADGAVESWEYDSRHRMAAQIGPRGERTEIEHDAVGRVTEIRRADGSTTQLVPSETTGFSPSAATRDFVSPPTAVLQANDVAQITDGNGNITTWQLDSAGRYVSGSDAKGSLGTVHRVSNLVTRETDGRGNSTLYVYDGLGNLVSQRDELSSDLPTRGFISESGAVQRFKFPATVGQTFYVSQTTQNSNSRLLDPDGDEFFPFNGQFLKVPKSGDYTLEFTGPKDSSFEFQLFDLATVEQLREGDVRIGTIDPQFGPEVFRFSGQAGQYLTVASLLPGDNRLGANIPQRAQVSVYAPNGSVIDDEFLPETAEYLIVVQRSNQPVDYHFRVTTPAIIDHPLSLNSVTKTPFVEIGETHRYTFLGTAGQQLLVDSIFEPRVGAPYEIFPELHSPSGQVDSSLWLAPKTLTETGTYTLLVRGPQPGQFVFEFRDRQQLPALPLGTVLEGVIPTQQSTAAYRLDGMAGQRLSFDSLFVSADSPPRPQIYVYSPGGGQLTQKPLDSDFELDLPATGTYLIKAQAFSDDVPVTFRLQVSDITDAPIAPSGFGVVHSGDIAPGEIENFDFVGSAGMVVMLDAQQRPDPFCKFCDPITITVRTPQNGSVLSTTASVDAGPIVLPRSGTYTVTVRGDNGPATGPFRFEMIDLSTVPVIGTGQTLSGTANDYETLVFRLPASAGDQLLYDPLASLGPSEAAVALLDSSGAKLIDTSFAVPTRFVPINFSADYFVAIEPNVSPTGNYNFRLLNGTDASLLPFDAEVSGTLDPGLGAAIYAFDAAPGDRILAHSTSGGGDVQWFIAGPGAENSVQNYLLSDLDETLTHGGRHYLVLTGENSTRAVDYSFRVTQPQTIATLPLLFNLPVTANLAEFGDQIVYTFSGSPGQQLRFNGLDGFSQEASIRLVAPSETQFHDFDSTDDQQADVTLNESGMYRLEVLAKGPRNAHFQFFDLATVPTIAVDELVTGPMDAGRAIKLFAMDVAGPMRIYIDNPALSGSFIGQLSLSGPDVFTGADSTDFSADLRAPGRYILQLAPRSTSFDYAFRVLAPSETSSPLVLGTTNSGSISGPGNVDLYSFMGTQGQQIFFDDLDIVRNLNLEFALLDPQGSPLSTFIRKAYVLPQDGQYVVRISGNQGTTPTYNFRVYDAVSMPLAPVGSEQQGRVQVTGEMDVFRIAGSAGQRLKFDMLSAAGDTSGAGWTLYDPFLGTWAAPADLGTFETTLGHTGLYFLALEGWSGSFINEITPETGTFDYRFSITDLNEPTAPVVGFGITHRGTLAPDETQTHRFTSPAGRFIAFDNQLGAFSPVPLSFEFPDGTPWFNTSSDITRGFIPRSGEYTMTVDGAGTEGGEFAFRVIDLATSPTVLMNANVTGMFDPGYSNEYYRFEGVAGQRLLLDWITDSNTELVASFITPDGQEFLSTAAHVDNPPPIRLQSTGTYYLVVQGQNDQPAPYEFRLWNLDSVPTSSLDQEITATLRANELAVYTFDVQPGQRLYFESLSSDPQDAGSFALLRPDNETIDSFISQYSFGDERPFDVVGGGSYSLIVLNGDSPFDFSFRLSTPESQTSSYIPVSAQQGRQRFAYDPEFNQVTSIVDELGHTKLFEIDPENGNRLAITEVLGTVGGGEDLKTRYAYLPHGLVDTAIDPLGRITDFDYNDRGLITSITFAKGTLFEASTHFEYDTAGNRVAVIDENGHRTQYAYDSRNRLTRTILPDPDDAGPLIPPTYLWSYDAVGNVVSSTDPLGHITQMTYDEMHRLIQTTDPLGKRFRIEYDAEGNRTAETDRLGHRTTYAYDQRDRLVRLTDALLSATQYEYDVDDNLTATVDTLGKRDEVTFDARNRVSSQTDALGNVALWDYDASNNLREYVDRNGNRRSFQYDDAERLIQETDALGGSTQSTYDKAGNVTAHQDELGRLTQFTYDSRDRLIQVTDPLSNVLRTTYDDVGNVQTMTDALGRVTTNTYDALDRLVRMVDPLQGEWRFSYDASGNRLTEQDALGRVTQYEYDPLDRRTRVVDPLGQASVLAFDAEGNLTRVTDRLERVTEFAYDAIDRRVRATDAAGGVMAFTYDRMSNLLTSQDELGRTTTFNYDDLHRLRSTADPLGGIRSSTYDANGNVLTVTDELGRVTRFQYDALDRQTSQSNPLGDRQSMTHDAVGNVLTATDELGRVTSYAYDGLNRVTRETDPLGGQFNFSYDAVGNVISQSDKLGHVTSYAYDALNRLRTTTDALGGVATLAYDAVDNVTSATDELGRVTSFTLDTLDRVTAVTDPLLGVSRFTYDAEGNRISTSDELERSTQFVYDNLDRLTRVTDALGGTLRYAYDAVDNLLSQTDQLSRTTTFAFDALNRRTRTVDAMGNATTAKYDAASNLLAETDALDRETSFAYDALNRPTQTTDALGGVRRTTYDKVGNVVAIQDELSRTTSFAYDVRDRQTTVTDPVGGTTTLVYDAMDNVLSTTDAIGHTASSVYDALYRRTVDIDATGGTTTYRYDGVDNLLRVTDPVGNVTEFGYDGLNRVVSETNALSAARTFVYDAAANLVQATDRNGRVREFTYDALNRRNDERWIGANDEVLHTFRNVFDAAGQLTNASDPFSSYSYEYDLVGRTTRVSNNGTPGVPTVVFDHAYDAVQNRVTRTETIAGQAAGTNDYAYDALDRMTRVTQSGAAVADKRVDFAYDAASQWTGIARFADLAGTQAVASSTLVHDADGRLTNLTHQNGTTNLATYQWRFDIADRLTQMTTPDGVSDFSYDDRNQITAADHSFQDDESYAYDENGNRTGGDYQTATNNRLIEDESFTYEYDAEGNRIRRVDKSSGNVTEYAWDYRNRLTQVVTRSTDGLLLSQVDYTYDIFDRRLEKAVDSDGAGPVIAEITRFVYDNADIALQFNGTGELTHRYLHGPMIDQILADESYSPLSGEESPVAGTVLWPLTDHQGTVRDLVDSAGAVANHITYDSFGQVTSETNAAVDHLFAYTGRERDDESDLYYYRARYYDPSVGRFISEDPSGFSAGDANLNRYVENSPAMFVDPSGLDSPKVPVCLKGLVKEDWELNADEDYVNKKTGEIRINPNKNGKLSPPIGKYHNQPYRDVRGGPIDHSYSPPSRSSGGGSSSGGDGGAYFYPNVGGGFPPRYSPTEIAEAGKRFRDLANKGSMYLATQGTHEGGGYLDKRGTMVENTREAISNAAQDFNNFLHDTGKILTEVSKQLGQNFENDNPGNTLPNMRDEMNKMMIIPRMMNLMAMLARLAHGRGSNTPSPGGQNSTTVSSTAPPSDSIQTVIPQNNNLRDKSKNLPDGTPAPQPNRLLNYNSDDPSLSQFQTSHPAPDNFTIHTHGNPTSGAIGSDALRGQPWADVTPAELLGRAYDSGYQGGPIDLPACRAGCTTGGGPAFGQQVANVFGQPVNAPVNVVGILGGKNGLSYFHYVNGHHVTEKKFGENYGFFETINISTGKRSQPFRIINTFYPGQ